MENGESGWLAFISFRKGWDDQQPIGKCFGASQMYKHRELYHNQMSRFLAMLMGNNHSNWGSALLLILLFI